MTVLIVVTHLLGTGHLRRALLLAQGFAEAGHSVHLVSGGMPVAGLEPGLVRLTQLPPLRSDGTNFTRLLDEAGGVADAHYLQDRIDQLTGLANSLRPDVVICELFPFGRRVLTPEFEALLTTVHGHAPRPIVLSSIRDILAPPSKPAKAEACAAMLARYFDAVLVHSDPAVVPLNTSWRVTPDIQAMLRYTGYVAPPAPAPHPLQAGANEILVSAGGGPVGDALYDAAIAAARLDDTLTWRLLVGGADRRSKLQVKAPGTCHVDPLRPDFRQMLLHAAASVSLCGYNTALDLAQTGVPAVLVPFDAGGEVEQSLRARHLGALPAITTVATRDLSGALLLRQVRSVMAEGRRPAGGLNADGAAETVRITTELMRRGA